jgi:hypothetical protein
MTRIEKLCAWLCDKIGTPQVLVGSIFAQIAWAVIGQLTHWDPYPFPFMLTVSNMLQLVLIFAVACGQRDSVKRTEKRSEHDHKMLEHLEKILDNQRA